MRLVAWLLLVVLAVAAPGAALSQEGSVREHTTKDVRGPADDGLVAGLLGGTLATKEGTDAAGDAGGARTAAGAGGLASGLASDVDVAADVDTPVGDASVEVEAPIDGTLGDVLGVVDGTLGAVAGAVGSGEEGSNGAPEEAAPDATSATEVAVEAAVPAVAAGGAVAAWKLRFVPWRRAGATALQALRWGFGAVGAAGAVPFLSLFSRIEDDELLKHPVRQQVLQFLEANPGATMGEVQAATGVAWGTVVYHLGRLAKGRHVVSHRDGKTHRYWLEADPQARVREAASVLKNGTPAAIADIVRTSPGIHQTELCTRLSIRPATASKYLKRLQDQGLVTVTPDAQRRHYFPTPSLDALTATA